MIKKMSDLTVGEWVTLLELESDLKGQAEEDYKAVNLEHLRDNLPIRIFVSEDLEFLGFEDDEELKELSNEEKKEVLDELEFRAGIVKITADNFKQAVTVLLDAILAKWKRNSKDIVCLAEHMHDEAWSFIEDYEGVEVNLG